MKFIVAHDLNNVIGINGEIPWHFKKDFAFFRFVTLGHPCIMGYKTYQEILKFNPNGLKDREMIVLSRNEVPDVFTMKDTSNDELLRLEKHLNVPNLDDVFVIGGASAYQAFLPYCKELYVTQILKEYDTKNALSVSKFPYNIDFLKSFEKNEILFHETEDDVELLFHKFIL